MPFAACSTIFAKPSFTSWAAEILKMLKPAVGNPSFGHGEKSVFLIERFLRLKPSEAIAIRWHMGGFDDSAKGGSFSISQAYEKYPLAVKLHLSDLEATYLREKGTSAVNKR